MYEENEERDAILKVPDNFTRIWTNTKKAEEGSLATEVAIFKPICPDNYVALGTYPMEGIKDQADTVYVLTLKTKVRCIKEEFTKKRTSNFTSIYRGVPD